MSTFCKIFSKSPANSSHMFFSKLQLILEKSLQTLFKNFSRSGKGSAPSKFWLRTAYACILRTEFSTWVHPIFNYKRTTRGFNRLGQMSLLAIESDILGSITNNAVIDHFSLTNPENFLLILKISKLWKLTNDIIDLKCHLTLHKINLTKIKPWAPPMGIQLLTRIYNVLYIKGSREKHNKNLNSSLLIKLYIYIYLRFCLNLIC